ncbi:hypothetical protein CY652_22795 [Burkholderia sp. WAC0059]|uniref:hypothetical protein n=1 Tax=Burkholderia sp. WAC0059 TaxID=2066022 RepID=UPI000C7ED02E|nr:hypothetical protein [Burkholderia sp. WAC0059]PLZ00117.1 hypothetical protein CY652_22795 [Burkholderia sp. WAC0059]
MPYRERNEQETPSAVWRAHTPQPDPPPPTEPGEPDVPPIGDPPPEPDETPHTVAIGGDASPCR